MRTIKQLVAQRNERRSQRHESIEYAISHARSASERNELIDIAKSQGVFV